MRFADQGAAKLCKARVDYGNVILDDAEVTFLDRPLPKEVPHAGLEANVVEAREKT